MKFHETFVKDHTFFRDIGTLEFVLQILNQIIYLVQFGFLVSNFIVKILKLWRIDKMEMLRTDWNLSYTSPWPVIFAFGFFTYIIIIYKENILKIHLHLWQFTLSSDCSFSVLTFQYLFIIFVSDQHLPEVITNNKTGHIQQRRTVP